MLAWWEILLMALGCAFIFLAIVWLWRRRARKQRVQRTAQFAAQRRLGPGGWRWRLLRFGERLFGHRASRLAQPAEQEESVKMAQMRAVEEARDGRDMDKLLAAYEYPRTEVRHHHPQHHSQQGLGHARPESVTSSLSAGSLYSQMTGMPHRVPEPREPVRHVSRFSGSTLDACLTPARATLSKPKPKSKNPFWG